MQLQHVHLFDIFSSMIIIMGVFILLLNFGKVLAVCEFFVSILVFSVQNLYDHVTIKMNGGHGYGKKQRNIERTRSGTQRRR